MVRNPGDVTELISMLRKGYEFDFLFFWGHEPEKNARIIGQGCLSQWWVAPFVLHGLTFQTSEHYMMWRKAMLFADPASAYQIVRASHPRRAKELGRGVRGFDQRRWEQHRYEIVEAGSVAKFNQHPDLARFLMETGERVLVEASPSDQVWGIGLSAHDPRARDPAKWRGLNLLGFALAQTRTILCRQRDGIHPSVNRTD